MLNPPTITDPPPGHLLYPDYSRPVFNVPPEIRQRIRDKLHRIYGTDGGDAPLCGFVAEAFFYVQSAKPSVKIPRSRQYGAKQKSRPCRTILISVASAR